MFKGLKDAFKGVLSVCIVITIIACAIRGAVIGYALAEGWDWDLPFFLGVFGFFIGIIVGVFSSILVYGFLGVIVSISDSLDKISDQLSQMDNKSENYRTEVRRFLKIQIANSCIGTSTEDTSESNKISDTWVCLKCGTTNLTGYKFCKNCGQ